LEVTGGTYYRTYDPLLVPMPPGSRVVTVETAQDGGPIGEADPATVSGLRLDKYLVTVGRFRQFAQAWSGGWLPTAGSGKHTHLNGGDGLNAAGGGYEPGWVASDNDNVAPTSGYLTCNPSYVTWTPSVGSNESLPINCVNWYEAYAFCIWDGGFLPSEAEWDYAAAGGSQQREYPWGATDPGPTDQYAIYACNYPVPPDSSFLSCAGVANVAPVGTATLGAGLWGQLDLTGEVFEWNLDWYARTFLDPCTDCAYLTLASYRVHRGGSFESPATSDLPGSLRGSDKPTLRISEIGFRCARTP
jgi:formylglycine-generating enzyme required for sulfatase activity